MGWFAAAVEVDVTGVDWRFRAPRIALAVAVVAVLLAGVGVVVHGRSPAEAGTSFVAGDAELSFNGVEVAVPPGAVADGTRVSLGDAGNAVLPARAVRRTGGGVRMTFEGVQPRLPVQVRIPAPRPPDGLWPVLITDRTLVPATYDAVTHRLIADVVQPQVVWGGLLDFAEFARDAVNLPAPARPDCAGRAVSASGVTVGIAGNYGADQASAVWPCVALDNGRVNVTLNAGTPMSYRVDVPSGWQANGKNDLLMGDVPLTYDVAQGRVPGTVRGRVDPGPYLGVALARMARGVLDLFGTSAVGDNGMVGCAASAGAARYTPQRPLPEVVADLWTALKPCLGTAAPAVLERMGGSLGAIVANLEPVVRNAADARFSVQLTVKRGGEPHTDVVEYRPWSGSRVTASLRTTSASGSCWATSTVSRRQDAYRCSTVDDLLYDPCFASVPATAQVVCPVAQTKAVLLTLTGALPSPPMAEGNADLFLLVLTTGLQCSRFTGNAVAVGGMNARFACDDHKTLLYGDPDTSGPLWMAQAAVGEVAPLRSVTIVKAYR